MVENAALNKLLLALFDFDARLQNPDDFVERFGIEIKDTFGVDETRARVLGRKDGITQVEEYAINTNRPYVDNRLSGYSAFAELINYYNSGFKSCAVLPIAPGGKAIGIITLLSKNENSFSPETSDALSTVSNIFGYQLLAKMEKEKSTRLAKYFDAAFSSAVPQALVDSSGIFVKVNKAMVMALDKSSKSIVGMNINSAFAIGPDAIENIKKGAVIEANSAVPPIRVFRISGSEVSSSLVHISALDITELKMLIDQSKIFEHSKNEALITIDKNYNIKWASANIGKVLNYSSIDLLGKKFSEIIANKSGLEEMVQAINGASGEYSGANKIIFDNNIEVEVRITAFRNSDGGISCILENNSRYAYTKNMENSLSEFVSLSGDAVISINELGYIESANKSAENLFHVKASELQGSAFSLLYSDADSQNRINGALSIARKEGFVGNIFANLVAKGEEDPIPSEQSVRRVIDENGKLSGYIITIKELATKRRMEQLYEDNEKLARNLKNAMSESDLKTQFIYNISHDLKTPITNIKGFSKLMLGGSFGSVSDEQKEYLKIILDEADRLMQLIQQILDVAKLSSGKIKLDLQQVNFTKLGENPSIRSLAEVARNKGLMFSWNVDYNVPEVLADPNRIIQVLVNLIGNSIKFTEHGGISVNVYRKGKNVRVMVKDTGIGISKEDQKKLFKKFYQVQKKGLTKQEGAGTGLGLSIAKEIIALHGGRIWVNSEPGKGSEFWFTVPISGSKKNKKQ
ncbi:MAG: ATP-binding protein [Candidatus Micrarchaeia archaeon]